IYQLLILPVIAVVGVAAAGGIRCSEGCVVGHNEPGPAALVAIGSVRAGDTQLPAEVLAGDIRFGLRVVVFPGEVSVQNQSWTQHIGGPRGQAVSRSDAGSGVAALVVDIDSADLAKHRR